MTFYRTWRSFASYPGLWSQCTETVCVPSVPLKRLPGLRFGAGSVQEDGWPVLNFCAHGEPIS